MCFNKLKFDSFLGRKSVNLNSKTQKMLKKHTILFFIFSSLCLFSLTAQKQASQEDLLQRVYSKSELKEIKKDKEQYATLCYALEHAIYLIDAPMGKDVSAFPEIAIEKMQELPSFTELNLKIKEVSQYFRVKDQNKLLIVKSMYVLHLEMNNSTKQ